MINNSPDNYEKFPPPVTGTPIPRGWFGRLVAFVNSLVLHGDKQYFAVEHGPNGTTIAPTTALINALSAGAGTPPGGSGAAQDISATVSGNTASVMLSGSTSAVEFVGTGDVTLSGNTNGQVEINCTGGGGGGGNASIGMPDYANPLVAQGSVTESTTYPGTAYTAQPVWLIGNLSVEPDADGQLALSVCAYLSNGGTTETVYLTDFRTQTSSDVDKMEFPVFLPIPAGYTVQINVIMCTSATPTAGLAIYPCIGFVPAADYIVTSPSGTSPGSLFYGLSNRVDNTVTVDPSLNGTPIDFEGASVL